MELGKKKSLLKYFLPPSCSSSSLLRYRRPRRIIGSKVVGRLAANGGEGRRHGGGSPGIRQFLAKLLAGAQSLGPAPMMGENVTKNCKGSKCWGRC